MPRIEDITVADEPERWRALGFDVAEQGCQLGEVLIRFEPDGKKDVSGDARQEWASSGIRSWSLAGLASADGLDGLPTPCSAAPSPRSPVRAGADPHPNGVIAIDHVVAVSPSFERSVERFVAAGMELRRVREEPTPAGAPRQAFFRLGHEILEMVEEPEHVVAAKGGAQRPVRFWGLALLVQDLDQAVEHLAPHVGEPRAAVQPGRRIATLRRSAGLSFPLALITPAPARGDSP